MTVAAMQMADIKVCAQRSPFYNRGGLVRPIVDDVPAAHGTILTKPG